MRDAREWNAAEALFAFVGWLMSLEEPTTFGAQQSIGPPSKRLTQFIVRHNLDGLRDGWENAIVLDRIMQARDVQSVDECAERLAGRALDLLAGLTPQEREARIQAMERRSVAGGAESK